MNEFSVDHLHRCSQPNKNNQDTTTHTIIKVVPINNTQKTLQHHVYRVSNQIKFIRDINNNMPTGHLGKKPCSDRCHRKSKTKIKQHTQCNKLSNKSKEKDIECNLRLKISTEPEETTASGKEFQVLIIRFEKKFPSRTDTVRDLYSLAQCPRVTALRLVKMHQHQHRPDY